MSTPAPERLRILVGVEQNLPRLQEPNHKTCYAFQHLHVFSFSLPLFDEIHVYLHDVNTNNSEIHRRMKNCLGSLNLVSKGLVH